VIPAAPRPVPSHYDKQGERLVSPTPPSPAWRRSRRCDSGACVEVAFDGDEFLVRDGKHPEGPTLSFTPLEWEAFLGGVLDGQFTRTDFTRH